MTVDTSLTLIDRDSENSIFYLFQIQIIMKCIGQVQSIGGEGVPSIYKDVVTSCLDCPKVGVEVVLFAS